MNNLDPNFVVSLWWITVIIFCFVIYAIASGLIEDILQHRKTRRRKE